MAVIQCDYFGAKYMGKEILDQKHAPELQMLYSFPFELSGRVNYVKKLEESEAEFNDMGMMQALDIVRATLSSLYYLWGKGIRINAGKMILFGSSHGAYLVHLSNLICPGLYAALIDVSSYLSPYYLEKTRGLNMIAGNLTVGLWFEYFIMKNPQYQYSKALYDLRFLYAGVENTCKVIAFQGKKDWMVNWEEKSSFFNSIENAELLLFDEEDVDHVLISHANHNLGMDFFELFQMMMPMLEPILFGRQYSIDLEKEVVLGDEGAFVKIVYESGLLVLEEITFEE